MDPHPLQHSQSSMPSRSTEKLNPSRSTRAVITAPEPGSWRCGAAATPGAGDLRRKRDPALIDLILVRSAMLPTPSRLLLEAVYRDGRTATELAGLIGQSPRTIRTRIKGLTHRVLSPEFRFVASALAAAEHFRRTPPSHASQTPMRSGAHVLDKVAPRAIKQKVVTGGAREAGGWGPTRRRVARALFIEGRSIREAARTTGLSFHTVRAHRAAIMAQFEVGRERDRWS